MVHWTHKVVASLQGNRVTTQLDLVEVTMAQSAHKSAAK
jgi:hypothetical protein